MIIFRKIYDTGQEKVEIIISDVYTIVIKSETDSYTLILSPYEFFYNRSNNTFYSLMDSKIWDIYGLWINDAMKHLDWLPKYYVFKSVEEIKLYFAKTKYFPVGKLERSYCIVYKVKLDNFNQQISQTGFMYPYKILKFNENTYYFIPGEAAEYFKNKNKVFLEKQKVFDGFIMADIIDLSNEICFVDLISGISLLLQYDQITLNENLMYTFNKLESKEPLSKASKIYIHNYISKNIY